MPLYDHAVTHLISAALVNVVLAVFSSVARLAAAKIPVDPVLAAGAVQTRLGGAVVPVHLAVLPLVTLVAPTDVVVYSVETLAVLTGAAVKSCVH